MGVTLTKLAWLTIRMRNGTRATVSKTAQTPEDEWTVVDVKDLNKVVGNVKASERMHSSLSAGELGKVGSADLFYEIGRNSLSKKPGGGCKRGT